MCGYSSKRAEIGTGRKPTVGNQNFDSIQNYGNQAQSIIDGRETMNGLLFYLETTCRGEIQ
uniref:Uncharacterized protein n=1 Tax=Cucumis melo TaxID=3656 RepID=A0A9I9E8L1_CUCME